MKLKGKVYKTVARQSTLFGAETGAKNGRTRNTTRKLQKKD